MVIHERVFEGNLTTYKNYKRCGDETNKTTAKIADKQAEHDI